VAAACVGPVGHSRSLPPVGLDPSAEPILLCELGLG